jgi:hypothetical protein
VNAVLLRIKLPISFLCWDRDRSFNGRDCHSVVVSMGPPLKMLETVNAKLKPKPEGEVKEESKACSTPSPSKKLATEMGKKISCLPGDTSLVKELVEHLLQFTGEGLNLDCLHPAQYVLDCLCGPHKGQFATQLENWYESYADFRGIKPKAFQATSCSAGNSGAIYHHPNSFLSIQCQQFDFY